MAGILGVIDLQQIRQSLGLSGNVHIPTAQEVDKIRREHFGSPPIFQTKLPDQAALEYGKQKALAAKTTMSMFYRKEGYSVGDLTFDLILGEDHAFNSLISAHPVDGDSDVTDHIQKLLQSGKLRGLISNHSIRDPGVTRQNVGQANALGKSRAGAAWEVCRTIWENELPVTCVTCLDTYRDVGISDMVTHRDPETGDAIEIEVSFKQIRRVTLKMVKALAVVGPKGMKSSINRQVAVKQSQGKKVGSEVIMDLGEAHITGAIK